MRIVYTLTLHGLNISQEMRYYLSVILVKLLEKCFFFIY